jgi:transposase
VLWFTPLRWHLIKTRLLEQKVTYAGIKQRWLIVESAERKQGDIQKLNSKIEQEKKTALKLRKKLENTGFDTVTKAQNYLKSINKKLKLWDGRIFRNQGKNF